MGNILVSIIIPCYNVADYIVECVESAFAQTYPKIEVICIDNNSNDDTWSILKQLKLKYLHLKVDKELKPGAPAARNKGLSIANGQWIQFLDADDLLLPSKISHQLNQIIKCRNDVNFIVGNCKKRNIEGKERSIYFNEKVPFLGLLNSELGNTCSNLFNAKYLKLIGGWNTQYKSSQEAKLMFELLKKDEFIIFDKEINTIVRERAEGQISQQDFLNRQMQYLKLRHEILNYLKLKKIVFFNMHREKILQIYFDELRDLAKNYPREAYDTFKKYFNYKFIPKNSSGKSTLYTYLFLIFGFVNVEKIYKFIGKA